MRVVTINVDNVERWLSWAEHSAPTMIAGSEGPGAIGACVPWAGAEEEGEVYWFAVAPSHQAAVPGSRNSAAAAEVAKIAPLREVRSRQLYSTLKPSGAPLVTGATWAPGTC